MNFFYGGMTLLRHMARVAVNWLSSILKSMNRTKRGGRERHS